MHLLDKSGQWQGPYLDQALLPGHVRIEVSRQAPLWPASDQYFVRDRDLRMVWAYLRAFGPRRVLRKIRSRSAEDTRNDAWLSIGLGWAELGGQRAPVAFVAPSSPRGTDRIVVPEALVRTIDAAQSSGGPPRHYVDGIVPGRDLGAATDELRELVGWQVDEGGDPSLTDDAWAAVAKVMSAPPSSWKAGPPRPAAAPLRERVEVPAPVIDRPSYHVFGLGQYAKVNAVANLDLRLHLAGVHEMNPAQLGPVPEEPTVTWDTSPTLRDDEVIDNAVIAGYHHTHAPLAVELIRRGARHVVIEKPLATSFEQLEDLLEAMDRHPEARVHAGFQRRHAPFNKLLERDLGKGPVSMSATVYEVPLPPRHWYRWPVVGNSVVSNGCHWIDYFLFLNDFADVTRHEAVVVADQVLLVLELESGASAAISLRHAGSPRLGVRDLITLWQADATVTIEDNSRYRFERGFGVERSASCQRMKSHEDMYAEFAVRIAEDLPGDDRRSIDVSTRSMLELARLVDQARSGSVAPGG